MKLRITTPSIKLINLIGFWLCFAAIGFAIYLQNYHALTPCPLCIAQRIMIGLLMIIFLLGWLHVYRGLGRIFHALTILLFSLSGGTFAGRQIWLEHLPRGQAVLCTPDFTLILERMPLSETLKALFQGTGECAEVNWFLFGFSLPTWTLGFFCLTTIFALWQLFRKK
ncbi:MAG: Disulfide bond formation protein B [Legionellaceae bacterium]